MKRYFLFIVLGMVLLGSCNPNKDIYDELDKTKEPYNEKNVQYTFTSKDYETFSAAALKEAKNAADSAAVRDIKTFLSFGPNRAISKFPLAVQSLLFSRMPALGKGSSVYIYSDYSTSYNLREPEKNSSLPIEKGVEFYRMNNQDYTNAGYANNFIGNANNVDTLRRYINTSICPIADNDQILIVNYKITTTDSVDGYFYYNKNATSWTFDNNSSKCYVLTAADYDEMGTGVNQPGANNNFSSAIVPQNYLPAFLKTRYTYAQPNDTKVLCYKYYASRVKTHLATYKYLNGNWVERFVYVDQFGHDGVSWKYNPILTITLTKADYQVIVDAVKDDPSKNSYYSKWRKNEEYWYGANAYYANFDFKVKNRTGTYTYNGVTYPKDSLGTFTGKTIDENTVMFNKRLQEGLIVYLEKMFPDMQPVTASGLPAYVEITYNVYVGFNPTPKLTAKLKVTDVGKFEVVTYTPKDCIP